MKKFLLIVALASLALLADSQWASARRGGCGGGGGRRGGGGCCMMGCGGYGGGCGMMMGGCGMGGCGMMMGGCGMGGCGMMGGHGGYIMGGGGCPGGVCSIGGSGLAIAQAASNEATLIVNLPENATLTIDGEETTSTSTQRVFVTPALEEGKEYQYTLKAKVERDGKVEIATTNVTFRAGETKPVELRFAQGVAAQ